MRAQRRLRQNRKATRRAITDNARGPRNRRRGHIAANRGGRGTTDNCQRFDDQRFTQAKNSGANSSTRWPLTSDKLTAWLSAS